jgi:hypothetical protein
LTLLAPGTEARSGSRRPSTVATKLLKLIRILYVAAPPTFLGVYRSSGYFATLFLALRRRGHPFGVPGG